jgi:hypothetical protein
MIWIKASQWLKRLVSRYPDNRKVTVIRRELADRAVKSASVAPGAIAVQCLEDPFYFGLLAAICLQIRALSGAVGELIVVRSISGAIGTRWNNRLARSGAIGSILTAQWIRAFRPAADRVGYRSLSFSHPVRDLLDRFQSHASWRRLRTVANFSAIKILDVPAGDLIIDSYLRFRPSARFDVTDPFVARIIWQVYRDVRRARAYFRRRRPRLYLTSYSTYIEHGIAARVALQENIRVCSFGSFVQFGKQLALSDWFHTPDTSGYRSSFQALDRQEERLAEAERHLRARLSGHLDIATSYMSVSAYAPNSEPVPDVAGATVVFLHDFYDSPHVYDQLIFEDFWAWICCTIEELQKAGRKFFLKPHPNQISLSGEVLNQLRRKYPRAPMLSARIGNVQLAEAGMICGVTVYGTVSHELAFLGIPTIACARHPHHAFDFCRTAADQQQYRAFLSTPECMPVARLEMRRQALEFYYMHNLYGDADALALKSAYAAFWKACHSNDCQDSVLAQRFADLCDSPAFKKRVQGLL